MTEKIPEKMKAIVLPSYNDNIIKAIKSLELKELPTPKPNIGQVLIKIDATTEVVVLFPTPSAPPETEKP